MELTIAAAPSLGALFTAESDRVFGFLLARCGSRFLAEDLTAETFLHANRQLAAGRGSEITSSWLLTVARRRLIDHWRSESARSRRLDRLKSEARRVTKTYSDGDTDTVVTTALDSLSQRYRAALVLRYLEDFSVSEVADALGVSYKAAESTLARARRAFGRAYEETVRDG